MTLRPERWNIIKMEIKMKKFFSIFAGLIVLISLMACAGHDVRSTKHPEQVVEEANQSLPKKVDPVMTLEKVSRDGSALTYHYVIDLEASELSRDRWQHTLYERAESACDNGNRKYFSVMFKVFDRIYYDFRDKDGEMVAITKVDRNTCSILN